MVWPCLDLEFNVTFSLNSDVPRLHILFYLFDLSGTIHINIHSLGFIDFYSHSFILHTANYLTEIIFVLSIL